jgi:hypothetical protein
MLHTLSRLYCLVFCKYSVFAHLIRLYLHLRYTAVNESWQVPWLQTDTTVVQNSVVLLVTPFSTKQGFEPYTTKKAGAV